MSALKLAIYATLTIPAKIQRISSEAFLWICRTIYPASCPVIRIFLLEQKQTWRATGLLVSIRVRTHETTPWSCCSLIGHKKTKVLWHQSEARTTPTVWNWSGKTVSPGAPRFVLYFSSPKFFFRPLRLSFAPTNCPWVSEDAKTHDGSLCFAHLCYCFDHILRCM